MKTTKFRITIFLEVAEQEIEDMQLNLNNYLKEEIEDDCLYVEDIEILPNEKIK
tara:strand:- start:1237 stop:1398 length:162 start_codon:yes stop_codon:yes gene_type:complete